MKKLIILCFLLLSQSAMAVTLTRSTCETRFSPNGGAEARILDVLSLAKTSVNVAIYTFTSDPIGNALVAAAARGVKVTVLVDRYSLIVGGSEVPKMKAAGIPIYQDTKHTLMHNKFIVVDGIIVVTGSYNFTYSAEHRNAENSLVCVGSTMAGIYNSQFQSLVAIALKLV